MKKYRELGFDSDEASKVVDALNTLLANYQVHNQKLRNFHWDVDDIEEAGTILPSSEMVKEILQEFESILSFLIDAHEKTASAGDVATEDLLVAYIKRTEQIH